MTNDAQDTGRRLTRLAWLPIPLLLATIAGLWVADLRTVYESRTTMVLLNFFFTWLASLCICFLTGRSFLQSGQPALLMFGCGSVLWGATSLAAAAIVNRINATVTIHNVGILAAAFCHLAGLMWHGKLPRPGRWLAAGYAGGLAVATTIVALAVAGLTPVFFVQDQGGTLVRQGVLILAVVLFAFVAWQMIAKYRRQAGTFYYWYGLGLALVATGLTGTVLLSVQGGILGWTNRLTQYLGSAYLFVAAAAAAKETGTWEPSLAGLEDAWRGNWSIETLRRQTRLWFLLRYGLAVGAVAAALWSRLAFTAWIGPGLPLFITFFPSVMVAALLGGFGPGLFATALASLVVDFCFLSPIGFLAIASPADRLGLVIFVGMSLFMSVVAEIYRIHRHKAAAYDREVTLRKGEERYRLLFQSLQEGFYLAEPIFDDQGQCGDIVYLDANPAFERLMGRPRDNIIGHRAKELVPGIKPEWLEIFGKVARTGEAVSHQAHSEVFGKYFESFIFRPEPGRIGVLVSDITARKQAEERLRFSEAQFRLLFESNPNPMWVFDETSLQFLAVNDAALRHYSYTREEFLALTVLDIRLPEERTEARTVIAGNQGSHEVLVGRRHHMKKDGTRIDVEITVSSIQFDGHPARLVLINDVTERLRSEATLYQSRAAALNMMQDAIEARKQTEQARANLERSVADLQIANAELARFNRVAVDRELRMLQLKNQVNELHARLGEPHRYKVTND